MAERHYAAIQHDCLASNFTPRLSENRRSLVGKRKNHLYGVKLCVQVWCQAVMKGSRVEEVSMELVAGWSAQTGETAHERKRVAKPPTTWVPKVSVVEDKVTLVVEKKVDLGGQHLGRSLEALGIRNSALARCLEQAMGMTEEQVDEWMGSLQRLGLKGTDIAVLVGKDVGVLRAQGPEVDQLHMCLIGLGLERGTVASMCLQWPPLLLCPVQQVRQVSTYLVAVGVSPDQVPVIFARRPQLLSHPMERIQHSIECLLQAGVPRDDLVRILLKVPELFSEATYKNLHSKVEFLLSAGLEAGALGKAVARRPNILNYNLDSMKTTAQYLQTLMRSRDVSKLVRRYAEVLVLDPERKMYPIVNYLVSLGVKREDLGKVILRRPQLLGYTIPGLEPTVDYILKLGVKPESLGKVITTSPQVLTLNVEEKLKPVVEFFRSIGLNGERDIEMLLVRNAQILCCSIEKNLRPKFSFFSGLGLTEPAIANMVVLFPSMLGQSIDGSLEPKYSYLVNDMHRSIDEVVDFPQYFGYSLEKRIRPRHEKLKEKK